MKRPVALVLTIVIFAAIAVCFLRPEFANPDFGYANRFDGWGVQLKLEGDSEYFAEARVVELIPTDPIRPSLSVTLRPKEPYYLAVCAPKDLEDGATEYESLGFIERRVDGEWSYYSETGVGGMWQQIGLNVKGNSLSCDGNSRYGTGLPLIAPIFDTPGKYRFTVYFRVIEESEDGYVAGEELHSIRFRYTVPEVTNKPFDVLNVHPSGEHGEITRVIISLRVNHGVSAPYMLRDGEYHPPRWYGYDLSEYIGGEPYWDEYVVFNYVAPLDDDGDHVTMHFAEHPDGSGEQYTLTLRLRFDE